MKPELKRYFPYAKPRKQQEQAIERALECFLRGDKRFVILEAGTGVGKSAIGLTVARFLNRNLPADEDVSGGSYFLTTQKILQEQYENDFGGSNGTMCSLYSSSNYRCGYHKKNDCRTSQQMLRTEKKGSAFFKHCMGSCAYKVKKKKFLESPESVTNFPYFITESTYSGKITPRKLLVVDEAHNTESVLSNFVEVSISQYFCDKMIKCKWPEKLTPINFVKWVKNVYFPAVQLKVTYFEQQLEKMGLKSRIQDLRSISMKYDLLSSHAGKLEKFLKDYSSDNWVMEIQETEKRGYKKVVYRAIDVAKFAEEYLFRMGQKVLLMSATILDAKSFAESLGIAEGDYEVIKLPSPFPAENRPIFQTTVGSMASSQIQYTLPKLKAAVEAILEEHKGQKGIIHCHTYKIANYLKKNIRSKRLLTHNSDNRDAVLQKHITSKSDTVLLSPSMTEGVDLKGDLSKFQIICKVPYPYLGDPIIKKRMNKNKGWYALQTAKSIVQSCGRSVRNETDQAVTYILDNDWHNFYRRNSSIFPEDFKKAILK